MLKKKNARLISFALVCFLFLLVPVKVMAANATISGPTTGEVGKTITVKLSFPKVKTAAYDFIIQYDDKLLTSPSAVDASKLSSKASLKQLGNNRIRVGAFNVDGDEQTFSHAASVTFKVKAAGQAVVQIIEASNGIENLGAGAKITVALSEPPPTTEPSTKATTVATTKGTSKATTETAPTTKSTTVTTAPTSTITTTSEREEDRHPSKALIGHRFDGQRLFVPETIPSDDLVPESYDAVDVLWKDKQLTCYGSDSLPYRLYWLIDEDGETDYYLYDSKADLFIPYLRVEWSSRFYTLSLLAEEDLPPGFALDKVRVWEREVPGYRPLVDSFLTKTDYDKLLTDQTELGEDRSLPRDIYLLALRMNDSENIGLYLYDRGIDSLIRADLWLVPLAGSILDPDREAPPPKPTEPTPTETLPTTVPELERDEDGAYVKLFGYRIPLLILAPLLALIVLLLALLLWLFVRARKAASFEPDLVLDDLEADAGSVIEVEESLQDEALAPDLYPQGETSESAGVLTGEEEGGLPDQEADEDIFQDVMPREGDEAGWAALGETLRLAEEKKKEKESALRRPPGIRPVTHRRPDRDDPEDDREL